MQYKSQQILEGIKIVTQSAFYRFSGFTFLSRRTLKHLFSDNRLHSVIQRQVILCL